MTKLTSFVTIGCDLGDKTSELYVLHLDGRAERPKAIKTSQPAFEKHFSALKPSHVVMEVGGHSRWVSNLLTRLGHEVTTVNPRRLQLITQSDRKNDRSDAELLARMARADLKLLSPVQHRGDGAQADLAVPKARDLLVTSRTKLVNHVRGTMKSFGLALPKCEAECFHRKTKELIPEQLQPALLPVYEALESLEKSISTFDGRIEELGKKYEDVEQVSQPTGVGILTALVFILTLEDKARFQRSREVGSFAGLTPRQDQSGDVDKQLGITKAGDPFLRRLLVNAANHIMRTDTPDSDLKRFGERLAARGGKNGRKRAKVAVARKLAVLMHRLWVTGEVYEPLRNTNQAAKATAA